MRTACYWRWLNGKTIIFSELVNNTNKSVLILVHRQELIYQTARNIKRPYDLIIPKSKYTGKTVVIAMAQTLRNRLKDIDINSFDTIIVDECHRAEFLYVLDKYNGRVIGFTATPNYEKTEIFYKCERCGRENKSADECCGKRMQKYKKNVPLSQYYHHLIKGIDISDLIKQGYLVPDENYSSYMDLTYLVYDPLIGDYTEESVSLTFGSDDAIKNTVNVFKEHCLGKKTIMFNPNTLINEKVYKAMKDEGINVKMYDTLNSNESRSELMEWFRSERDAVLLNVQVFTTGLDVTDIECVFLNKKTQSINLYIQMVGRGGRPTDKIFKPKFKVIDLGQNIDMFGEWSSERDWASYFYRSEIKLMGSPKPAITRTCHKCEALLAANSLHCMYCGAEKLFKGKFSGEVGRKGKTIIPTPEKIIEYCESNNLNCNEARKIVIKHTSEAWEGLTKERYLSTRRNSNFYYRASNFLKPYYFAIQRSKIDGNRNRKLDTFVEQLIQKIDEHYN